MGALRSTGVVAAAAGATMSRALGDKEQAQLDTDKEKIRFENDKYLRAHPELAQISTVLISEVLVSQPVDPVKFVAQYTTQEGFKNRVLKAASTIGVNS